MKFLLTAIASIMIIAPVAHAADPVYGSPAPGQLSCQLTYSLYDPSAPAPKAQAGCPFCMMIDPQHSSFSPPEFKMDGAFTYIYVGAKSSGVQGTDGVLTFSGSAQIGADGSSTGTLNVSQGNKQIVNVMGAIVGTDLQVQLPVQGLTYKGKIVEQIGASCYVH